MPAESEDVELTPEDKKYLKQIAQDHGEQQGAVDEQGRTWTLGKLMGMGFTRRDAMAILSGIAVGIPFSQAVMQRVSAAASTSDSDGNVGLPADRVDVFADGLDIASDVVDDSGNTLIQESSPAWMQQVGTSSSPVSSVHTADFDIAGSDAVSSGDFLAWGPSLVGLDNDFSTTSTSYVITDLSIRTIWNDWRPSGAQSAFTANGFLGNSNGDVRLRNSLDAENLFEQTNFTGAFNQGPTNYTPTTTGSVFSIRFEIRTNDSGTSTSLNDNSAAQLGVQV